MNFKTRIRFLLAFGVIAGLQLISAASARAASGTWNQAVGAGPFSWPTPGNWSVGVPNGSADIATFGTLVGATAQSVTLDTPGPGITLATLNLNSTSTSYTISNGSGTGFTFAGAAPAITVGGGGAAAQTINASITNGGTGMLSITNSSGAGLLTLGGTINNGGQPVYLFTAANATVTGAISGNGALYKRASGTILTLSAPNTYSGGTYLGGPGLGTLDAGTILLSGGNDRLLNTSVVNFHSFGYLIGSTYTSKLDIGSTSQTLSTIHLPGADAPSTSQAPTGATVTIAGSGGTLKLNGDNLYIGISTNSGTYSGGLTHTVNMSTLTNFIFDNSAKQVAVELMGATRASGQVATLIMATNNTVTASNFLVGNTSPGGSVGGGSSTVTLGSGANVLTIGSSAPSVLPTDNAINVGFGVRSSASLSLPALPTGGSVTIRGYNGGLSGGSNPLVAFNIGHIFNSADNTAFADVVDFSTGTVDALITNMMIGLAGDTSANTLRTGRTNASFSMGAGTVTVGTLTIGSMKLAAGTTVGMTGAAVGTLRSNGSFTITNGGTLNATTINIAENLDLGASLVDASDVALVTGALLLTNGTVRATTIAQPHTATSIAGIIPQFIWTSGTVENTNGSDLAISGVPIILQSGTTHTFNATNANSITQEATAPISGATFGITKTGTGTLTLSAANTYTGPTAVNAGTLMLTNSGISSGTGSGDITIGNGATAAALVVGNGTAVGAIVGNISFVNTSGTSSVTLNRSDNVTYSGIISGSNGQVIKQGGGILTLSGANTFNGNTTVSGGTLNLKNQLALQNSTLTTAGVTFDSSIVGNAFTLGGLSGSGNITLLNNAGSPAAIALSIGNNGASTSYTGVLSNAGSLVKIGGGTTALGGANTFGGNTTVSGGTLNLKNQLALQNSTLTTAGVTFDSSVGGNAFTLGGLSGSGNIALVNNAGSPAAIALSVGNNGANTAHSGALSGAGSLVKIGGGTLTLTGSNNYSGGTTVSNGTLQGNSTSLQGAITNNAAVIFNQPSTGTYAGNMTGTGTLTKTGGGKLILTGTNGYTGATVISNGTLQVDGNTTGTTSVTIGSGGRLGGSGAIGAIGSTTTLAGGTLGPGASINTLDIGGTVNMTSGTFEWEFSGGPLPITNQPIGSDVLNVGGALNITAAAVALTGNNFGTLVATNVKFVAISYSGLWNGGEFIGAPDDEFVFVAGKRFIIKYDDTKAGAVNAGEALYTNAVTFTAVPEASSILVMGLGGVFAIGAVWFGKRCGIAFGSK